jgi:hypothetical protein
MTETRVVTEIQTGWGILTENGWTTVNGATPLAGPEWLSLRDRERRGTRGEKPVTGMLLEYRDGCCDEFPPNHEMPVKPIKPRTVNLKEGDRIKIGDQLWIIQDGAPELAE